jgi:hypothetical protein
MTTFRALLCYVGLTMLVSCGGSKEPRNPALLLSGACEVVVRPEPKSAEVSVDRVPLGTGAVRTEVPCGIKKVIVRAPGRVPHEQYVEVIRGKPLTLDVELERQKSVENFALSAELVKQAKAGQGIYNVFRGEKPPVKAEGDGGENWGAGAASAAGAGSAGAGAASSATPEESGTGDAGGDPNTVDYWR